MKKVLSLVLTFVMVAATFAMLVPTASAASGEIVLFEDDFEDSAYTGKTGSELLDAVFGEGGYAYYQTDNTKVGATIEESVMGGKALHIDARNNASAMYFQLANDALVQTNGVILEMEYIFGERGTGNAATDHRMFGLAVNDTLVTSNSNQIVGLVYNNDGHATARNSARYGHWDGALQTPTGQNFYNLQGSRIKYHCEITATSVKLYAAEWDTTNSQYKDLTLIGEMNNTVNQNYETKYAAKNRVVAALMLQNANNVTIDNVKLTTVIGATFPEAPTSAKVEKLLYTEDFSNASYATLEDAALADAIFGAGNHNQATAGAGLSIVDGALNIDAQAATSFLHMNLSNDAVISDGYVAEADYTFHTSTATDGRFITFGSKAVSDTSWPRTIVVGPYGAWGSSSSNARICVRNAANAWKGITSYATPANVNTMDTTYRMRATICAEYYLLEVAKYTDGVLGDYVEIGKSTDTWAEDAFKDILTFTVQNGANVTIDNITVTSITSNPSAEFAGYQPGANEIRLVGLLDDETFTNATAVGFKVAILGKGEFKTLECNYVYESIDSDTAASLHVGYEYLYAMHITDIPAGEYSFMVVPYYVLGGETVYGAAKNFVVNIANAQ